MELEKGSITYGDLIGEGGYGAVYQARWMHANVAAKTYRVSSKGSVERAFAPRDFYKELSLLCRLRHPNITLLIGFCVQPQYIIVTEFISGGSLFDYLHNKVPALLGYAVKDWNFSNVVGVARGICLGMVYIHANGVVHCDLKSSNVLLTATQEVKICDFGLAHFLGDGSQSDAGGPAAKGEATVQMGCVGTHHWMAPEVLRGEEYSKAADVYSFGMILWEMISRKVPFHGYSAVQVIGLVGYGCRRPRTPSGCPEPLGLLLRKALRSQPQSRCSFQELAEHFENLHRNAIIDVEESLLTFLTG